MVLGFEALIAKVVAGDVDFFCWHRAHKREISPKPKGHNPQWSSSEHIFLIKEVVHATVEKSKNEWGHRQLMARGQGFGQVSKILGDFARRNTKDEFVKPVDKESNVFYLGYITLFMVLSHKVCIGESFLCRVSEDGGFLAKKTIGLYAMGAEAGEEADILHGRPQHSDPKMEAISGGRPKLGRGIQKGIIHGYGNPTKHNDVIGGGFPHTLLRLGNSV